MAERLESMIVDNKANTIFKQMTGDVLSNRRINMVLMQINSIINQPNAMARAEVDIASSLKYPPYEARWF